MRDIDMDDELIGLKIDDIEYDNGDISFIVLEDETILAPAYVNGKCILVINN